MHFNHLIPSRFNWLLIKFGVCLSIYFCSYFIGTPQHFPGQRHLYRTEAVPPKNGLAVKQPRCLTCSQSIDTDAVTIRPAVKLVTTFDNWDEGDTEPTLESTTEEPKRKKRQEVRKIGKRPCLYHDAHFPDEQGEFVLIECLGPDVPSSAIYRIYPDEHENPLQLVYWVQNNTKLRISGSLVDIFISSIHLVAKEKIIKLVFSFMFYKLLSICQWLKLLLNADGWIKCMNSTLRKKSGVEIKTLTAI